MNNIEFATIEETIAYLLGYTQAMLDRIERSVDRMSATLDYLNGYAQSDPEQVAFEERARQREQVKSE